jgi:hypothetical protein
MHTMNNQSCSECGDLDGCHLQSRLSQFRIAVDLWRREAGKYGIVVPKVICLCGSTRFIDVFRRVEFEETLRGRIVLTIGCDTKSDSELFHGPDGAEIKARLDTLHFRKIDLADEILVLNAKRVWCLNHHRWTDPTGFDLAYCCTNVEMRPYIGDSTRGEIAYARATGKPVRFLEDPIL